MARNSSDNSGCGCLILIVVAITFGISKCTESKTNVDSSSTLSTTSQPSSSYSNPSSIDTYVNEELSVEDRKYLENSLSTGAAPYSAIYGKNYHCPYSQCSGINVTAPHSSDVVVIIKKNNECGRVVAHAYIQKGETYELSLPDGTYQTFFYFGKGWNPYKEKKNGVQGGFVIDESYSKDEPQVINQAVLSYVLQLRKDGNFQTEYSNQDEVF